MPKKNRGRVFLLFIPIVVRVKFMHAVSFHVVLPVFPITTPKYVPGRL
jgi:hypothetical protein